MSDVGAASRVPAGRASPGRDATAMAQGAFLALARAAKEAPARPGALAPPRLSPATRDAWVEGLTDALHEQPVISVAIQPAAILHGATPIVEGNDRALPERLHAAGARAITLFAGAEERELSTLARLLTAEWDPDAPESAGLEAAVWGADLTHVHFDFSSAPESAPLPGAAWRNVLALLEGPAAEPSRLGTIPPDALQALRELRETFAPEPAMLAEVHATGGIAADLATEAAGIRAIADIDPGELAAACRAALASEADPARQPALGKAVARATIDLLVGDGDPSPLLHAVLELLDPELTPGFSGNAPLRAAFRGVAAEPLRSSLAAHLPTAEAPELRGPLFSLLSLLDGDDTMDALAEVLPSWAVRVLGDTMLLREGGAGPARPERIRARLAGASTGAVQLGLAMAARVEDARLLEPILALADHARPEVREGVLFAVRNQRSSRVRDLVRRRLDDPAEPVRIEALRYSVAYRLAEAGPWVEARLADPTLADASEAEVRALCIAYGRLARDRAETPLLDLAVGRRRPTHAALPRFALHGLRAIGTPRARSAIEHVASEVPRLREEALALAGGAQR